MSNYELDYEVRQERARGVIERSRKIALPKGRNFAYARGELARMGIETPEFKDNDRWLVRTMGNKAFCLLRQRDIVRALYADYIDCGLVGGDIVAEVGYDYDMNDELADSSLKFIPLKGGECDLTLAALPERCEEIKDALKRGSPRLRIATSYPNILRNIVRENEDNDIEQWSRNVMPVRMDGSVEVAPCLGIADAIFDVVESGSTLEANGLKRIEKVLGSSLGLAYREGDE